MMLRDISGDPPESDRVVEDEVSEESPMLVTARWVVRKVEPIPLQVLPEELGSQGVVLGSVLGAAVDALEGSTDRVVRISVAELHRWCSDLRGYLAEV